MADHRVHCLSFQITLRSTMQAQLLSPTPTIINGAFAAAITKHQPSWFATPSLQVAHQAGVIDTKGGSTAAIRSTAHLRSQSPTIAVDVASKACITATEPVPFIAIATIKLLKRVGTIVEGVLPGRLMDAVSVENSAVYRSSCTKTI